MKKLIITILLALTFTLGTPLTYVQASSEYNDGGISKELENVDLSAYESEGKTQLITLAETGFGKEDFALIAYVYNANKSKINKTSKSNVINMAFVYDSENKPTSYYNFKLKYVSSTEDDSIYKFKVVDVGNVLKNLATSQNSATGKRKYSVSGIQLITEGAKTAVDYAVGKTYVYSGDSELKLETLTTVELEVRPAWYRTETSDKGAFYQHQLNSVYFSVPEKFFEDGYKLNAVKAEWYEYKTEPILVIDNNELYSTIKNSWLGVDITKEALKPEFCFPAGLPISAGVTEMEFEMGYNVPDKVSITSFKVNENVSRLTTVFLDDADAIITSERLTDYIYSYNASAEKGYLDVKNGQISADLFQDGVDAGRTRGYNCLTISVDDTYDLLSYSETHTWWDYVGDYGFWNTVFGNVPTGEESKRNVTPIYEVKPEDLKGDVKEKVLISNELIEEFKTYYNAQDGKKTFMFRFANTDYRAVPLLSSVLDIEIFPTNGYFAEETVFLDFDVIQLEFFNGAERVVVPVVSDPIDVVPSITPPPVFDMKWVIYAIVAIVALIGVGIIYNLIQGAKS